MMLQQTQVARVIPKYKAFLKKFPTLQKLAKAKTLDVLKLWSGLGYNRRALYLKRAAEAIVYDHHGKFPKDVETLESLPGIGAYTARAITTFTWNEPNVFIETNIRSVFIHEFSPKAGTSSKKSKKISTTKIRDREILLLVEKTLDRTDPRQWYWALMDYGAMLKTSHPNPSRKSAHYAKQSKFEGSNRQIRGALVRLFLKHTNVTEKNAVRLLDIYSKEKVVTQFRNLKKEGFYK